MLATHSNGGNMIKLLFDFITKTGIREVHSLMHLITTNIHHILSSFFNIPSCNWHALVPAFLHSTDSVLEKLLFFLLQAATSHAYNVIIISKFASYWVIFKLRKANRSPSVLSLANMVSNRLVRMRVTSFYS